MRKVHHHPVANSADDIACWARTLLFFVLRRRLSVHDLCLVVWPALRRSSVPGLLQSAFGAIWHGIAWKRTMVTQLKALAKRISSSPTKPNAEQRPAKMASRAMPSKQYECECLSLDNRSESVLARSGFRCWHQPNGSSCAAIHTKCCMEAASLPVQQAQAMDVLRATQRAQAHWLSRPAAEGEAKHKNQQTTNNRLCMSHMNAGCRPYASEGVAVWMGCKAGLFRGGECACCSPV